MGPMMNQMMSLIGAGSSADTEELTQAIESRLPVVQEITRQFKDPSQTTFVCVCIAEFLSMYETERLVQVSYSSLSTGCRIFLVIIFRKLLK